MSRSINFIPFARPSIGAEEEEAVLGVLRSGWLTTGKVAKQFENGFSESLSVSHAIAVNSATAGLHLALNVLGVGKGDWVVSTPYTFTSTVEIARYLGAHPLFADIGADSFNIDPVEVEKVLDTSGKHAKCIIPVHLGGLPCDMKSLHAIAEERNMAIVEDAAHAYPCQTNSGPAGTVGDFGVFSFYATKTITTGEGGMLVTSSDDYAQKAKILRLHGIDRDVWNRYQGEKPTAWEYDVVAPGYKYNLADLNAAVGLCQLEKAADFRLQRESIANRYLEAFSELDFVRVPPDDPGHSWHLFIINLVEERLSVKRDDFIHALQERGIGVSVHYKPLHIMSYYRSKYGLEPGDFPRSLDRYLTAISLPIYPGLSDEEVEKVIAEVAAVGKKYWIGNG
jgi:dTDP-4-amino-4,6-dideoxygalactose transaminase